MEENLFDIQMYAAEKNKYQKLAAKFGLAMIVLVLNNFIAPLFFVVIAALFSTGDELSYYAVMIINALSAYTFPILIFWFMFRDECKAFVPDRTYKPFLGEAVMLFTAGMAMGVVGNIITLIINAFMDFVFNTGQIEEAFAGMKPQNMSEFAIYAFCICIVAPIAEEFIFRNLLLKPLRAYSDMTAAIVSGLIFGLYHANFDQFAYAFLLGVFFAAIAVRYNSILPTILLHAVNNVIVTFGYDLMGACNGISQEAKAFCQDFSAVCSFFSTVLTPIGFIALFVCIFKKCLALHHHNRYVPANRVFLEFVKVPLVIIGIIVMFVPFFV